MAEETDSEKIVKWYNSYISMDERAALYRGQFLQAISHIEGTIDDTLAVYFCPLDKNKQEEIMYALLSSDKMTLFHKYSLFMFLAERHCNELYKQHNLSLSKSEKKKNPNYKSLRTRTEDIISLRNKFAHRKFNYSIPDVFIKKNDNVSLDTKTAVGGDLKEAPLQLNDAEIKKYIDDIKAVHDIICKIAIQIKIKGLEAIKP